MTIDPEPVINDAVEVELAVPAVRVPLPNDTVPPVPLRSATV